MVAEAKPRCVGVRPIEAHGRANCSTAGVIGRRLRLWLCTVFAAVLALGMPLRQAAGAATREITSPPGVLIDIGTHKLHLFCEGRGDPTVVMDAGLGGWSLEWNAVQRLLAGGVRACAYDRAGYGWSDPGPGPRSSSRIVEELHALLVRAQLPGPYVLVGHSFGGYNVQLFAERYPHLTAGVVLVDSSHPQQVERFLAPPLHMNTAPSRRTSAVMLLAGPPSLPAHMPDEVREAALMQMSLRRTRQTVAEEYLYFRDSAAEVRAGGDLPAVPLLVLSRGIAERDTGSDQGRMIEALWRALQQELAARSPQSAHFIAAHSGHHIHLDQPRLVANAVLRVVDAVHPSPGPGFYLTGSPAHRLDGAVCLLDRLPRRDAGSDLARLASVAGPQC